MLNSQDFAIFTNSDCWDLVSCVYENVSEVKDDLLSMGRYAVAYSDVSAFRRKHDVFFYSGVYYTRQALLLRIEQLRGSIDLTDKRDFYFLSSLLLGSCE